MFTSKNIDVFTPRNFERMGMLKGKRWYESAGGLGLFKPQRNEFGDKKVFCGNHYGEVIGYILSIGSTVRVCKAELACLSKYYPNIHKERNHGTPIEKVGCITYSQLERNQELEHGKIIIDNFTYSNKDYYNELTKDDKKFSDDSNDNLEVILASIEYRTREFYRSQRDCQQNCIEKQVKENRYRAIQMIVYDCLYGNNDRHDENWAMVKDCYGKNISMYPLYDNERIFGLYENQNTIEKALKNNNVEEISENILFSRMRVPGEKKKHSSYKDVLQYMMYNYAEDTKKAINELLNVNPPEKIKMYLEFCEGLPSCYVEFGLKMFEIRYEFAKKLCLNKVMSDYPMGDFNLM